MDTAYLFNKPYYLQIYMTYTQAFLEKILIEEFLEKLKKESGELISLKEFAKLSIGYHQTEVDINEFYLKKIQATSW